MNIHSKTRRRVRIFVVATLLLSVGLTAAYFVRKRQIAERVLRDRDAGYVALKAGDYYTALHKIGPYVQRHPTEVDALLKYADARRNVEEPNGRHLSDSISLYRRILEQNPEQAEAREQLLLIYVSTGFNTEILATTDQRSDPASLRARCIALANLGKDADARATAQLYLAAKPDDLRMQMFFVSQMQRARTPADEIVEYATKLTAAHGSDPRYELLTGFAYGVTENRNEAIKHTLKATSQTLTDPEHIEIAVDLLDSLDREDEALNLITRAAEISRDQRSQRRVIARLYQARQFKLVDDRVASLAAADPKLSADILAHRAMALQAMNQHDASSAIVTSLADRPNDFSAAAWAKVLRCTPHGQTPPDDRAIIEATREGLRGESDNPYFRLYLGDAYYRLGESDMAATEWLRAAQGARVWGEPLKRVLQLTIPSAQPETVRATAARLKRLAPGDPAAMALVAAAQARLTNRRDASAVEELLQLLDLVLAMDPGESTTLALKVNLLALARSPEEAGRLVTGQLSPDKSLPVSAYIALARASEARRLALEQPAFARCRTAHGESVELAAAEAAWMVRQGRSGEALSAFEAARTRTPDRDDVQWKLAWLQLLDNASDSRAGPLWIELADAAPENAAVQHAALTSQTVLGNRDLQRRVIDRLKVVIGDNGVGWRLAEARWILAGTADLKSGQDRERELVKATSLINDLVQQYPEQLEARLLLADCLLRLDKRDDAIAQLTAAVRLSPGSFGPAAQLASLLQSKGEFDQAKPHLERAESILERSNAAASSEPAEALRPASTGETPDLAGQNRTAAWRLISSLYLQRGDTARAVEILKSLGGDQGSDASLAIAEMQARRGELSDDACRKLLEKPTLTAIEVVAEQYARTGRNSEADAVLDRLNTVDAKPGERELVRGLYHQRRKAFAAAIPEFQQAAQNLSTNEQAWKSLLQCLVMEGHGPEAADAAGRAAAALPGDAAFKRMAENSDLIRDTAPTARLRPLLAAMVDTNDDAETLLAVLRLTRDANASGKTVAEVISALRPIADRSPRLVTVQYLLADLHQAAGNDDEALTIVTRLIQLQPNDPLPVQRAVEILSGAGRWREVIPVSQQWRTRLGAVTLPADESLARAYVATGQYDAALAQLEPYAALAAATPQDWGRTLTLRAQALIGLRRTTEAEAVLFPSLSSNAGSRDAVMRIAARTIPDSAVATRWLEQAQAAIPADAIDERLALAQAWLDLSNRPGQDDARRRVGALLVESTGLLEAKADARSDSWVVVGMLNELTGDDVRAEAAYRAALKIKPDQNVARNNLAMVLVGRGKIEEALHLAEAAAKDESDPGHAEYLDTLAQIQSKAGQHDDAERSLRKAVALAPRNVAMQANLVQLLIDAGKLPEARQAFDELEGIAPAARRSDAALDARIKSLAAAISAVPPGK